MSNVSQCKQICRLISLNKMKAADEITDEQSRQVSVYLNS